MKAVLEVETLRKYSKKEGFADGWIWIIKQRDDPWRFFGPRNNHQPLSCGRTGKE